MGRILSFFRKEFFPTQSRPTLNERRISLDVLKLISAFMVAFYHFAQLDYGFSVNENLYLPNFNRIIMSISACSIPLFFIINGILIFSKHRTVSQMYYKVIKIFILMLVWQIAQFPSWFFKTLLILYLAFPLFQWLWEHKKAYYYAIIICLLIFPFLYNYVILFLKMFNIQNVLGINIQGLSVTGFKTMYSIVYFLGGNVLAQRKVPLKLPATVTMMLSGWLLLVFEVTTYTNLDHEMYDGVNSSFPTIGALLLAVGFYELVQCIHFEKIGKILLWLSDGVLPIYLLHMSIMYQFKLAKFLPHDTLPTAIISTMLVCLICILLGKLIRKIPILCFFMKI